jgi:hypothetical protein
LDKTNKPRVVIDIIKSAYYIPYFDLGLGIHSNDEGELIDIFGRVSKLIPGEQCLFCSNIIDVDSFYSEMYNGTKLDNEYIKGLDKKSEPQLISYNSIVADIGFNSFLEYILGFGNKLPSNLIFSMINFLLIDNGKTPNCALCKNDLGKGDEVDLSIYIDECNKLRTNKINCFHTIKLVKDCSNITLNTGEIIIEYNKGKPVDAIFLCPCGCGEIVKLGLGKEFHPKWKIRIRKNFVTFLPSINEEGFICKSHFFIKDSKVIWVE